MEDELLSAHEKLKEKALLVTSLKAKLHASSVERKRILFAQSRQANLLKDFQADFHELSQKIEVHVIIITATYRSSPSFHFSKWKASHERERERDSRQ